MEFQTPLIKTLLENKTKILQAKRYSNESEYNRFLNSIIKAERERQNIIKKIKEIGSIDLQVLKSDLGMTEEFLIYNIEYLL